MPLVRCPTHGRVYDNAKEEGCPLCREEALLPRAPKKAEAPGPEATSGGRLVLLAILGLVVAGGGGAYWYLSRNPEQDRAQIVRDSLRAIAAGPARPDTTKFAAPTDLTPIRRARALRTALDGLLRANRATILGMREGPFDTAAAERAEKQRARQYAAFVGRWHQRLDAATAGGTDFRYAPGTRMGPQMESVTNYLGAAVSVMRDLVPREHVKPRAERQADITATGGYLNSAGTVLTNLPR